MHDDELADPATGTPMGPSAKLPDDAGPASSAGATAPETSDAAEDGDTIVDVDSDSDGEHTRSHCASLDAAFSTCSMCTNVKCSGGFFCNSSSAWPEECNVA